MANLRADAAANIAATAAYRAESAPPLTRDLQHVSAPPSAVPTEPEYPGVKAKAAF